MTGIKQDASAKGRTLAEYLITQCARVEAESMLWLAKPPYASHCALDNITQARTAMHLQRLPLPVDFSQLQSCYSVGAILIDLTDLHSGEFLQQLARLKNQYCNYIECIIFDSDRNKEDTLEGETTLFSLGFRHSGCVTAMQRAAHCFRYELKSYNKKRSWNSPKDWANPQNFNKYRW